MGIGVILKNKNKKKLKIDIKDFSKLKFSDYFKNFKEYMNIIEYRRIRKFILKNGSGSQN